MMISIPDDNKPVFQHHSEIIGLYKIFVIQREVMALLAFCIHALSYLAFLWEL